MKVVQTLATDLPWNFHVCLVLPLIFKPSNRPSPLEYNVHKNSLVPRRPARFSLGLASHLFVRKRQHGNRRYAMVCIWVVIYVIFLLLTKGLDSAFLRPLRPASWAMIKRRVRWKRFHGTSRGWLLTLIVLCTSFPRPRRRRSGQPMTASAEPRVHNTSDRQITPGKSLHCNGSCMSAVLGLSALL